MRYVKDNGGRYGLEANHEFFEMATGDRFITDIIKSIEEDTEDDMSSMDPIEVFKHYTHGQFYIDPVKATLVAISAFLSVAIFLICTLICCFYIALKKD